MYGPNLCAPACVYLSQSVAVKMASHIVQGHICRDEHQLQKKRNENDSSIWLAFHTCVKDIECIAGLPIQNATKYVDAGTSYAIDWIADQWRHSVILHLLASVPL